MSEAQRIARAIKEIEESGLGGNQVHEETLRTALAALRAQEQNEPLTLEQVELLNGKPIFVVFIDCEGDTYKQWFLVDTDGTNTTLRGTDYNLYVRKGGTADMYHITAYTHEPKGADQ